MIQFMKKLPSFLTLSSCFVSLWMYSAFWRLWPHPSKTNWPKSNEDIFACLLLRMKISNKKFDHGDETFEKANALGLGEVFQTECKLSSKIRETVNVFFLHRKYIFSKLVRYFSIVMNWFYKCFHRHLNENSNYFTDVEEDELFDWIYLQLIKTRYLKGLCWKCCIFPTLKLILI